MICASDLCVKVPNYSDTKKLDQLIYNSIQIITNPLIFVTKTLIPALSTL